MDEPLGALDAEFRHLMCGELRDLHDRINATTIYVTHDQLEAMSMADTHRRHERRPGRADRLAAGNLRSSGQHVRRRLHRLAADEFLEFPRPPAGGRIRSSTSMRPGSRCPKFARRTPRGRSCWGCAPSTSAFRIPQPSRPGVRRGISRDHPDRHRRHGLRPRRRAPAVESVGEDRRYGRT